MTSSEWGQVTKAKNKLAKDFNKLTQKYNVSSAMGYLDASIAILNLLEEMEDENEPVKTLIHRYLWIHKILHLLNIYIIPFLPKEASNAE